MKKCIAWVNKGSKTSTSNFWESQQSDGLSVLCGTRSLTVKSMQSSATTEMLFTERWLFAVQFVQVANAKGFTGWSFYLNEKDQSYGISKHGNLSRTGQNHYQLFGKMASFVFSPLFFRPHTSHLNPNNTNSACPYLCCSYQSQSWSLIIIIPLKIWSNTTVTHFLPTLQTLRLGPHRTFVSGEDLIQASSPDPGKCSRYQTTESNAGVTVLFHGALRPQKTYGLLGTGKIG